MRRLILLAIGLRVIATLVLMVGPWTDSASELAGWDVERFQQISDIEGRAWVDEAVEYPPGSVVLIEALAQSGVVGTHRVLALASLAVDLGVAFAVGALGGRRAAAAYLILGLPLVPMGLLRFDLWAVLAAVLALAALRQRRPAAFALFATVGALIKVWPALLLAAAAALGRGRTVAVTVGAMTVAGLAWLGWSGWTLDPVEQVISLRGTTGWHVESVPGSIVAIGGTTEPELQNNAYRIGTINNSLVLGGRALTLVVIGVALVLGLRQHRRPAVSGDSAPAETGIVALVMTASVGALILTSPLLSPQFLLWLTPWAALAPSATRRPSITQTHNSGLGQPAPSRWAPFSALSSPARSWSPTWWLTLAATATTGVVLALYGPAGVAETTPAVLLLGRDLFLVAAVATALAALGRAEGSLGHSGTTPCTTGSEAKVDEVTKEAGPLGQ